MQSLTFESSAVDALEVDQERGLANVTFKNGNSYRYDNVSKKAIKALLTSIDYSPSIGKWVNTALLNDELVNCQLA